MSTFDERRRQRRQRKEAKRQAVAAWIESNKRHIAAVLKGKRNE